MSKYKYFCYTPDSGFETYRTSEEAKKEAEDAINYYRDYAEEGWDEEVSEVCWGEIKQETLRTELIPVCDAPEGLSFPPEVEHYCDYYLEDV